MKIKYTILFHLKLSASYHFGNDSFQDLEIYPTPSCKRLLCKYRLLCKQQEDGLVILYPTDTAPGSVIPIHPIPQVENFHFLIRVADPGFWMYADVQGWKKATVFFLTNPSFNSVANQVIISNATLTNPIRFYPLIFKYDVVLQATQGLLEVRNATGILLQTLPVRAIAADEPAGATLPLTVSLAGSPDGVYELRYVNSGGTVNENVFCSEKFSPDILAVVQMQYRTGAWTGANPDQKYRIIINNRKSDWLYDIHLRDGSTVTISTGDLAIQHIPAGEPPVTFTEVAGSATADFVQFESAAPVDHWKRPIQLKLTNQAGTKTFMDPLPLPTPHAVEVNAGNLVTRVIVNV